MRYMPTMPTTPRLATLTTLATLAALAIPLAPLAVSLRGQSTTMIARPPNIIWLPNEAATGTELYHVVKLTGIPSAAVTAAMADTSGMVGICVSGCGLAAASATASIANWGNTYCTFDGGSTAGHYYILSPFTNGHCTDSGAAYPTTGQVLGRVLQSNVGPGVYPVLLFGPDIQAAPALPAGIPSWNKYAVLKIANGVNGCASANGCWQVNGVLGAAAAAALSQDVILTVLVAQGHVTDYRIKVRTRCTGAATALTGLGLSTSNVLYRTRNYDIDQAVVPTAIATGPPTAAGSDSHGVREVVGSLLNTVNNIDQLVVGCAVDYWLLQGVLP